MSSARWSQPRVGWNRLVQLARLRAGIRTYLGDPIDPARARRGVRQRVEQRQRRFLDAARSLIYDHPRSAYRRLLEWAGCDYADLEQAVKAKGLEGALEELRRAGVYLTLDEFKAKRPIVREGLEMEVAPSDFDSPLLLGRGISARTSGSRSPGTRVYYDWLGLAEEAETQLLLDLTHGVERVPLAIWFPTPPSVAGLRNVLLAAKAGRAPERWFSHDVPSRGSVFDRAATAYLLRACQRAGLAAAHPRFTPPEQALEVAQWLAGNDSGSSRVLRTITSSAIRAVEAAGVASVDLRGATVLIGGEPLGQTRRQYLEAAGVRVVNRYVTAEAGIVGAGCGREDSADGMHLLTDRIACVVAEGRALLTTLSLHAGKVLLNTSLGDQAELSRRACDCEFGQIGMRSWLSRVRSDQKVTLEGMNLRLADLHQVISVAVAARGGGPDDFQLHRTPSQGPAETLDIVVSPRLGVDRAALRAAVLTELAKLGRVERLTADAWERAGALRVIEAQPRTSAGHKLLQVSVED